MDVVEAIFGESQLPDHGLWCLMTYFYSLSVQVHRDLSRILDKPFHKAISVPVVI
jgi:hypothetical protein